MCVVGYIRYIRVVGRGPWRWGAGVGVGVGSGLGKKFFSRVEELVCVCVCVYILLFGVVMPGAWDWLG